MIPDVQPVKIHYGNNEATEFDFDFYLESEEQLLVEHTDMSGLTKTLVYGVDYSVEEFGMPDGSKITFPLEDSEYNILAWDDTTGQKEYLVISLNLPFAQEAEFDISGDLNKKNIETALDYEMRCIQILNRKIGRAVLVPEGMGTNPQELISSIEDAKATSRSYAQLAEQKATEANEFAIAAGNEATIAAQLSAEVAAIHEQAMTEINSLTDTAIEDININTTNSIEQITNLSNSEQEKFESLSDEIKNNADDITDAIETGLTRLKSIDALKTFQITNCLTEIPQRVKLELVGETFTIKAGSIVVFPDSTKDLSLNYTIGSTYKHSNLKVVDTKFANGQFFVWAEIQKDVSLTSTGTVTVANNFMFIRATNGAFAWYGANATYSGSNTPTAGQCWYDTTNNIINTSSDKFETYANGALSLPICDFARVNGVVTKINQVFNDFGYIGSAQIGRASCRERV